MLPKINNFIALSLFHQRDQLVTAHSQTSAPATNCNFATSNRHRQSANFHKPLILTSKLARNFPKSQAPFSYSFKPLLCSKRNYLFLPVATATTKRLPTIFALASGTKRRRRTTAAAGVAAVKEN